MLTRRHFAIGAALATLAPVTAGAQIKPGEDVEVSVDDGALVMTPRERASV